MMAKNLNSSPSYLITIYCKQNITKRELLYTVRQSFPEPSSFQYSERTIASTETKDTPEKSP